MVWGRPEPYADGVGDAVRRGRRPVGGRGWAVVVSVGVWGVALGGGGCEVDHGPRERGEPTRLATPAEVASALAPASMRVHPLTRLEPGGRGGWRLVVHLELLDPHGHSGKWLGRAEVGLEPVGGGGGGGGEAEGRGRVVTLDWSDAGANAVAFDWISRTYRVVLDDLPSWARPGAGGSEVEVEVRARFTYLGADGLERSVSGRQRVTARAR